MTSWPLKQLSEICEINPRLPRGHAIPDDRIVSFVPMAAVDEIAGAIKRREERRFGDVKKGFTHFQDRDVLFAKITPCMENGKAALTDGLASGLGFGSTEFHVLRAGTTVLPEWLFYFVRQLSFRVKAKRNFTGTAGQQRVPTTFLSSTLIPVPPLAEQRRSVDLLMRAESIVRLRREAQQKAAELVPAIFLEMLGDPATNPKGWPKVKLGDYLTIESTVKTPDPISDASLPCIGADSIESGTGKLVSWPTVEQIKPISGKYHFGKNDVLYSKIRPALRKTIVAPESGFCSADMYPLRPKSGIATPEFVASLLLSKAFTEYAIGVSARAQMPKVNRETLFAYEHPMPPISLQQAFANRMQDVNSIQRQQESALVKSELVFASLLGKSFS